MYLHSCVPISFSNFYWKLPRPIYVTRSRKNWMHDQAQKALKQAGEQDEERGEDSSELSSNIYKRPSSKASRGRGGRGRGRGQGKGRGRAKNKPKPVPDLQSSSHKRKDSESKESQERPLKRPAASKPPQDPIKFISYCEQYYSTLLVLFNSVPRFTCTGHEDDRANEDRSRGVASHCREGARLLCS